MSTRLLLDGEDLRTLMLRVRDEMGPDARIVRAERVRTGGIAGFFAKEHYELTVEVPEPPRRRLGRARAATTIDAPRSAGTSVEAVGLDALLAAADAVEGSLSHAAPTSQDSVPDVSTGGETFADVLAAMHELVGTEPAPSAEDRPAAAPERTVRPAVFPQLDGSGAEAPTTPTAPSAPAAPQEPPGEDLTAPAPEPRGVVEPDDADRPRSTVASLLELGIPTRLLAGSTDPHAPVALSQLVRRFDRPRPVRLRPGNVVVVAGEPEVALRTAQQMTHRAGLAPTDVVLAGDLPARPGHGRRLLTTIQAARFREKVPDDVPTVVALGVGPGAEHLAEAAALLAALEPDDAWAAIDARSRGVELRRWLRAVGARRPFDAVAATETFAAQAPGTVLNLGVPVGWVDGLPASPVVWAAVLSERLADDARWE
ncbi:hypothetical protein [Actinotalea sp.]|uniref:hypothetical protein n=1 Tax=Actinotalea sp. TaxID=1872145 RepID=UPI003569F22A